MDQDKQIIYNILNGQKEQYRHLVNKYQKPVFKVIYRIVGDYEETREVSQETFVKIYTSLSQYKDEYKFFSWLYRTAINCALVHVKNKKQYTPIDEVSNSSSFVEEHVDKEARRRLICKSINELPEKYRAVIALKYYANMSYQEIANTIGIPEKKVKSRLFDARKLLKNLLVKTDVLNMQ